MASIKTIAKLANTSVSSVSRVLNNNGYVSAEVRENVENAIKTLNYRPSSGARVLRSGRSLLVGVLLPTLDVQFFGILAHTMEQALFDLGYQTFICSTAESGEHELRYIAMLLSHRVDGVIVASAHEEFEHFSEFKTNNIPIVAVDRDLNGLESDMVAVDHEKGGRMMAEHLLELGHKRIAVVGAPAHSQPIRRRIAGITDALRNAGLEPFAVEIGSKHNFEETYRLASSVIGRPERPTAIIGTTDIAAIGTIHAAHDAGLSIPEDISIIGFDDIPSAAFVLPRLTTVAQPIRELGRSAVARLHRLMSGNQAIADQDVPPLRLVMRETTAPVAKCRRS
ncbi:transcriptional regulator [Agrobacterium sp. 13-626]|nr:transcriptional regulator [Agrobacterium sp. 13-626]